MNVRVLILIFTIGVILTIFGIIFQLQGQAIVGPESSFMYSNPEWITNGLQIMLIGFFFLGVGIALKLLKKVRQ